MASLAGAGIVSSLAKVVARVDSSLSGDKERSEDGKRGAGGALGGADGTPCKRGLGMDEGKFLLATLYIFGMCTRTGEALVGGKAIFFIVVGWDVTKKNMAIGKG